MIVLYMSSMIATAVQAVCGSMPHICEEIALAARCLFCHHHFDKFFIVDLSVAINVGFPDHFINLLIGELLTQVCHDMAQLCCADEAITITVKNLEGFDQLF